MRGRFILITLIIVLLSALAVGGCAKAPPTPAPTPTKPLEITLASSEPPPSVFVWGVTEPWAKEVEESTNGRVKFIHHNAGALGPIDKHWNLAVTGVADVTFQQVIFTAGVFPLVEVGEIPGTGISSSAAISRVMHEMYLENEYFQKELEKAKVLFFSGGPPRILHTRNPVRTLEDIKGMKVGTIGHYNTRSMELLGASPVNMPVHDMYLSMETGLIDGFVLINEGMLAFKLTEVSKYTININLSPFSSIIAANWDFWNSLPADLQKIIEEVSYTWSEKSGTAVDKSNEEAVAVMKQAGVEFYDLPPEEQARWYEQLKPMMAEWVATMDAKGIPGQAILDKVMELAKKY